MENSGNDKQNESDDCDVSERKRENADRNMKTEAKETGTDPLINMNEKNEMKTLKKTLSTNEDDDDDDDEEDEEDDDDDEDERSKESADEEERKETKTESEKKEQGSSTSDNTSTSTSDDESETSSDDKTEPAKSKTAATETAQAETTKEDSKESATKNEDTTDDSDIEDDLVSAINYNTITSLAALKDMLQSSGEDSDGVDSFFHHYFLSHVNRLPSRNQTHSPYPWGRRLSECREEDEYETEEGKNTDGPNTEAKKDDATKTQSEKADSVSSKTSKASSPSSSENSSSEKIDEKSLPTSSVSEAKPPSPSLLTTTTSATSTVASERISVATTTATSTSKSGRFTTSTVTSPTSTTKPPLRRRHTTGPGMTFPATDPPSYSTSMTFSRTSPLPSPHLDKRFFDSSLIEMKSQASSTSTLDYDSTEEVWVRRMDFLQERKRRELGSQPLPTIVTEDADNSSHVSQGHRPRADTWGSHSKTIRKSSYGSAPSSGKSTPLPQPTEAASSSSSSGKDGRKTSGTRSGSTSRSNSRSNSVERRRSGGGVADELTASPTRKPALFDAFRPRSKSDAGKRKPSIIANMKSAVQHSLHRGSHGSSSVDVHTEKEHHRDGQKEQRESKEQGGRPRAGSESSRNPVSKVMDLIRHRSHSALSAEDKRKARAAVQHQTQIASQSKSLQLNCIKVCLISSVIT
ncbi:hypothetical protein DMN91_010927 [Ooceraea biroi]|uniref:Uncharacterized protein n=1 Tax=Ooceraea biroi TaxID=2015173 RepID=A0A3L8DAG5_OOCBI|nr:hypothetical protein DMN91_010927 [Ooceraea biroi]